jgi:hypothetical protein
MNKKLLLAFCAMLCAQISFGQATLDEIKNIPIPYESVEYRPEYPGGIKEFMKYIEKNFKAPAEEGISGDMVVSFIIDEDGKVNNPQIIKKVGKGNFEDLKKLILNSPKWTPGENIGIPVKVLFKLPIKIRN